MVHNSNVEIVFGQNSPVTKMRNQFEQIRNSRSGLEQLWDLVFRMVQPNYRLNQYFNKMSFQTNLDYGSFQSLRRLYHNRGAVNSGILASYLHSNLSNPHAQWMKLNIPDIYFLDGMIDDETLNEIRSLQRLTHECHANWQSGNFHATMYPFYKSLVDIGTACSIRHFVVRGRKSKLVFGNRSMFNVYYLEDAFNDPSCVFCVYNWTAYQIVSFFYHTFSDVQLSQVLPQAIYKSYQKKDVTAYGIIHAVFPQGEKFLSSYFYWDKFKGGQMYAREDEFLYQKVIDYQPYSIVRIRKNPESPYGTGFSTEAYPLLATLQNAQKKTWVAIDKNIDPPMNTPTDKMKGNYSTQANSYNPMDTLGGKLVGIEPSIPQIPVDPLILNKQELLRDIDQTYMIDKILMEQVRYNRSATEVNKRSGEEIKILSPFIGSLEAEFLRPLVELTLVFLNKHSNSQKVREAINTVSGKSYRLQYVSPIAQAQIKREIENNLEFYGYSNAISQKDRRIDVRMNWLLFWEKLAVLTNAPFDTIKNIKEFNQGMQAMEQANKQAQQNQQMQNLAQGGGAYKDFMQGEKLRRVAV